MMIVQSAALVERVIAQAAGEAVPWGLYLWYALAAVGLILGALFSGSEIGLYSLSKIRLRLRTARGEASALTLQDWLRRPTYALEGLLVLQNIASFAFTAAVTGILSWHGFSEIQSVVISMLVVTPMVLVFSEIMPKDLFHTHADQWTYRLVPLLKWTFRLITVVPILPLVNLLSRTSLRLVTRGRKRMEEVIPKSGRMEMLSLFQESAATGVLTGTQQDLVQRALRLARVNVQEVMIPWNRVVGVPATISREGFRALVKRYNVSRMPVMGRSTNEVLGIVDVLDVLTALARPPGAATFHLLDHVHAAMTLIGEQSVRSAITLMQKARQTLAVVVDHQGRAIGLVTMKDLVEELVGDLENW